MSPGSDAILTRCLWAVGLGVTDPGAALLPPDMDPADFPEQPERIDSQRTPLSPFLCHFALLSWPECLLPAGSADGSAATESNDTDVNVPS